MLYKKLDSVMSKYTNITWIITNEKVGQLAAADIAYSFIRT